MNTWIFTGNLGRDAEQRFTQGDHSVVSFSVAVKAGYGDKATTVWPKCTMWGKQGESVLPYLTKGQQVCISGEVSLNEYTKKDGGAGFSVEVRVDKLTLVGGKREQSETQQERKPGANVPESEYDDDLPF